MGDIAVEFQSSAAPKDGCYELQDVSILSRPEGRLLRA